MASAERIIRDIEDLRTLKRALAQTAEYQPGRVRVTIDFQQPIRDNKVRKAINEVAMRVVKSILTPAEMRTRMQTLLATRIAAIEARYPDGFVD